MGSAAPWSSTPLLPKVKGIKLLLCINQLPAQLMEL